MNVQELWVPTKHSRFLVTVAYMRGAYQAQLGKPAMNPYKPGEHLAQYNYGYANEIAGFHDTIDLPFETMYAVNDSAHYYKPNRRML